MRNNFKILIVIISIFSISFGLLFFSIYQIQDKDDFSIKEKFFEKENFNKKTVFLLGSSHIGVLNMTHVISHVEKSNSEYEIFNLAENGDTPKIRINDLEKIIESNPKIVFYGISFRDFEQKHIVGKNQNPLDIKQILWNQDEDNQINPQLITRRILRDIMDSAGFVEKNQYDITPKNTPFFALSNYERVINSDSQLQRQLNTVLPDPKTLQILFTQNEDYDSLSTIIEKLHENNIKIIIFTTPLSHTYFENIDNETKNNFDILLKKLKETHNVTIYDFTQKYFEQNIWNNLDHIAFNSKSIQFSEDIGKMIIQELN